MTDLDHSTRYDLMKSDQVPADELAEWLKEPGFAAYVEGRNASMAARQAGVNAPAPSADAVVALKAVVAQCKANHGRMPMSPEVQAVYDLCVAAIAKAALASTIPAAEPVVKPLEWRDGIAGSYTVIADTVLGQYSAWHIEPNGFWRTPGGRFGKLCGSTLETAKAAAQADYEQRIRSALVASPPPARETEAIETAPHGGLWWREDFAQALAKLDGVTLQDVRSTVGPADDANSWRTYLGKADDLMAALAALRAGGQPQSDTDEEDRARADEDWFFDKDGQP